MTIQEAIKSGRPFRRAGEQDWWVARGRIIELQHDESMMGRPTVNDLLADDWELKPERKVTHAVSDVDWMAINHEYFGIIYVPRQRDLKGDWSPERFRQFHGKRCNVTVEVIE